MSAKQKAQYLTYLKVSKSMKSYIDDPMLTVTDEEIRAYNLYMREIAKI